VPAEAADNAYNSLYRQTYTRTKTNHANDQSPDIVAKGTKLAVRIAQTGDHRGNSNDKVVPASNKLSKYHGHKSWSYSTS